jgi:hypothetical protein
MATSEDLIGGGKLPHLVGSVMDLDDAVPARGEHDQDRRCHRFDHHRASAALEPI